MMRVGITLTPGAQACAIVEKAETAGLDSAFFVDSPALFGDPYVSMGAAAARTRRIVLGMGVTNPLTRSAPVTASVFASLNALAPGRVVLGLGTGYTATRAMGQRSATLDELERYVSALRRLLGGEVADVELGGEATAVQFLNQTLPWVNLRDPIPIHVAASGRRSLALAGRIADGVILGGAADPSVIESCWRYVAAGARLAGRNPQDVELTVTASMYVTDRRPGFEELRDALGPMSFVTAATYGRLLASDDYVSPALREDLTRVGRAYEAHTAVDLDPRTAHLRRYRAHRRPLEPWQATLVTEAILGATTIAGTVEQCYEKIRNLERLGVRQLLAVTLPENLEATVGALAREILPRLHADQSRPSDCATPAA